MSFTSWGGLPEQPQIKKTISWRDQLPGVFGDAGLVVGMGRSYGDVPLSINGIVASARGLDRLLGFDSSTGLLHCEAGVSLGEILAFALPRGWSLPVVPGTQFCTVGGATANDVHGKNHHARGTFGRHVKSLLLQRSSGEQLHCSSQANVDWFSATIGGLGLTGVILELEIQLSRVDGPWLDTETIKFGELDEFFSLSEESDSSHEYNVAWIDCLSRKSRGHFTRANHSAAADPVSAHGTLFSVPFAPPVSPVNRFTLKAFNSLYYHRQQVSRRSGRESLVAWNFPLDRLNQWNRLYGKRGFRQYQCVVPEPAIKDLLACIRQSGDGSFLAVLKMFGDLASPGLLSFPRPGTTLALDFPWRGADTLALFKRLDQIVAAANGAIYPAKDAHMSGEDFRRAYPAWEQLEQHRDPVLKSQFWQRVTGESG